MFISEERRIAERVKEDIKNVEPLGNVYIMLINGRILDKHSYFNMVNSGKVNPQDTYTYIGMYRAKFRAEFHYPFLGWYTLLLNSYLSKLGFYNFEVRIAPVVPATGLKYVASGAGYGKYLVIEVSNLDTAVSNTNLRKIVFEVLDDKIISREKELPQEEYEKIFEMFNSQKLFADHDFDEARYMIEDYYDEGKQSLAKEVARISIDYYRIFQPYRVCYDMDSWKEIDCLSIKL